MKILVIGGTGFIGPYVIRDLLARGHEIAVFHRGETPGTLPDSVRRIRGNRNDIAAHRAEFERFSPEVVVDFILADERQTRALMDTFRGLAGRAVAISSQDVYRAYEVLLRKTPGPLQELPITEDSDVRTILHPYSAEQLRAVQKAFSWFTEEYDKIPVERTILSDARLPGTVLRLPMVYGPGDPLHRFFPVLKRMDDERQAILFQNDAAKFVPPRGYVENVAAAIALAAVSEQAAGRIYNIAEEQHYSELEWARKIAEVTEWQGSLVPMPAERLPAHLRLPLNTDQHWIVSSVRIRRELGFVDPVPLGTALSRTIEWERANPPQIDPRQFDYAAEDAALEQHTAARA
jgi:nucleoside-diphosphate-sugar epimerase